MSKIFFLSSIFQNCSNLQQNNNIKNNQEMGYDVLANKAYIKDTPKSKARSDIFFINKDINLMAKINGKQNLTEEDIDICPNSGGGNCFYKAISQFFFNTENYHIFYRKEISEYIEKKKDTDSINYPYIYKNEKDMLTWHEYFNELKLTGTFAGQYEIINTSLLYNCNIIIYRNNNYTDQDQNYSFQFETIINKYSNYINPFASIILLGWVNNNHYVLLFPKKNITKE